QESSVRKLEVACVAGGHGYASRDDKPVHALAAQGNEIRSERAAETAADKYTLAHEHGRISKKVVWAEPAVVEEADGVVGDAANVDGLNRVHHARGSAAGLPHPQSDGLHRAGSRIQSQNSARYECQIGGDELDVRGQNAALH